MLIEIKIPVFAESVTEGTIAALHKKVGQAVARDENIADIETDKIVLELPAPQAGVLVELSVAAGDTVTASQIIGKIDTVTLPARLIHGFFGQHSPALCAIGIIGASNSIANRAPPVLNLESAPGAMRVPSGNIIIHTPSLSRTRA